MSGRRILVFAKPPIAGRVKTRLLPRLEPHAAARLHAAFVADVVSRAAHVAPVVLYQEHGDIHPFFEGLAVELKLQQGADLGERMARALCSEIEAGNGEVLILGADSPDLPTGRLEAAFAALEERRLVLGPAVDGGYYLIGASGVAPPAGAFAGIPWGTEQVLGRTLAALAAAQASFALLEPWYDVDRPADLDFLRLHLELLRASTGEDRCPHTRQLLETLP